MGDAKEVRLRFSRVIRRRPIPYIPHHNLLQRQQMEQERRRLSAVVAPNAGASGSESEEQTLPIIFHIESEAGDQLEEVFHNHSFTQPDFGLLDFREYMIERYTTTALVSPTDIHKDKTCVICLDEFIPGDTLRILSCTHIFHANCVDIWFRKSLNCPICRQTIGFADTYQPQPEPAEMPTLTFNMVVPNIRHPRVSGMAVGHQRQDGFENGENTLRSLTFGSIISRAERAASERSDRPRSPTSGQSESSASGHSAANENNSDATMGM